MIGNSIIILKNKGTLQTFIIMKKLVKSLFAITIWALVAVAGPAYAQDNYKHPHLNSSGQVLDSTGTKLGWVKEGIIYNTNGEKIGKIEKQEISDYKGHKLGTIGKDGTFYDPKGTIVFTIEPGSKGEKCKIFLML